jgi:hypothetical protein
VRFRELCRDRPDIAIRLLSNLGRLTANRLQLTSDEVRALEKK